MGGYGLPPGLSAARIGLPFAAAIGSSVILVSNLDEEVRVIFLQISKYF